MLNKELEAQISLLEDPDRQIYTLVRSSIVDKGVDVIPFLEQAWDNSLVPLVHQRIEDLIHDITFNQILNSIENWVSEGQKDWFGILFLLSKFYYHNINKDSLRKEISIIKDEIWIEINDNLTAFEKVQIINQLIFKKHNFKSEKSSQQNKKSYFLSEVMSNKKGNDLGLGMLYLLICNQLNLPVYGVNLLGNFILAYVDPNSVELKSEINNEILFYINPINNGTVFGPKEIDQYIEKNNLDATKESFFLPASNQIVLERYIDALKNTLVKDGEIQKAEELDRIKELIKI